MNRTAKVCVAVIVAVVVVVAAFWLSAVLGAPHTPWNGIDDTVLNAVAREAGRSPSLPLVDPDRTDLSLFIFLAAGVVSGFVAGYFFRGLFSSSRGQS